MLDQQQSITGQSHHQKVHMQNYLGHANCRVQKQSELPRHDQNEVFMQSSISHILSHSSADTPLNIGQIGY